MMKTHRSLPCGALLAALLPSSVLAGDDEFERDRVVMRLAAGVAIETINARYATAVVDSVAARGVYLLDVPEGIGEENFAELLRKDPDIRWADVNAIARDPGPGTQSFYLASTVNAFDGQYTRTLISLPDAHQVSIGVGMIVAVLDTGIDAAHPAFTGGIAPGGYNFIDNTTDVADAPSGIDSDGDGLFDEMVGHGTFVSGLVRMAAPGAALLPIKVLDSDGWTTSFRVAEGVDHAVGAGAHVINLSLGSNGADAVMAEAVSWAAEAGIVVVAAAGNEGNEDPGWSPATVDGVLGVAGTDEMDVRADFSNFGAHIDLCAPGVDIVSTLPGGGYGRANGTSYSAPLVAGVAALVRSARPGIDAGRAGAVVIGSTDGIADANPGYDGLLGSGRLNAAAAARRAACRADLDADGQVSSQDFFDFLTAFFAGASVADFNADAAINSQDLFDFLTAFFAGC